MQYTLFCPIALYIPKRIISKKSAFSRGKGAYLCRILFSSCETTASAAAAGKSVSLSLGKARQSAILQLTGPPQLQSEKWLGRIGPCNRRSGPGWHCRDG